MARGRNIQNRQKRTIWRAMPDALALLVLLPVLTVIIGGAGAVTQSEIDALKQEQEESQARQEELKEELSQAEAEQSAAEDKRDLLLAQLDAINDELSNIKQQIAWYDEEIAQKEVERKEAEAREAEQYELFCQRVRAMEEEGTVSYWSILFNAESFSDLLDRLADVDAVMSYDNQVMEELTAAREELEQVQAELESARAEEQAVKEQQEAKKAEQQAKVAEAEELLAQLNANVEEVNRLLEEEDAAATAIQADIEKKQAELEAQRQEGNVTLPPSSSGYQWPLPASNLKLTSAFGYRIHPVTHVPHSHTGIDVSATTGTPITAAKSGQVIISEEGTGSTWSYGSYVVIDHGDRTTTLYAHMNYRAVSEGEIVTQGQYIGDVGATGNVTGPHLHFEVRVNGQRVDPESCFPDLYDSFIRAYNW